jgi:acyl carrier protein
MRSSFSELVRQAVALHLEVDEIEVRPSQHLRRDWGLDPLDLVLIALRIEDRTQIEFPIERLDGAETVGDITRILRSTRARPSSAAASRGLAH